MAHAGSVQLSHELRVRSGHPGCSSQHSNVLGRSRSHLIGKNLTSHALRQDSWSLRLSRIVYEPVKPGCYRSNFIVCRSVLTQGGGLPGPKIAALVWTRSYDAICGSPLISKLIPVIGIITFAVWGLGPLVRFGRIIFLHKTDISWKKSSTYYVLTSYMQPLLLWTAAILICRAMDPVVLRSEASHAIKQRLLIFVRSLSTVMAFAYCFSSLIQQLQKFFMETNETTDARNMGFSFAGKAVYTAVWVAAVSLFMELLGFSTQKWLTAGGLGTVLLTLAGREIFTNFLSSVMIHVTRPFVVNEWIQTKIEGYEVSGTVEHVGWWSPTVIRGDDREAIHIPNHKFTVNVVRNLTQKAHWRIKTHIAISHLDVNKINIIVADMRKVLSKNPQVEQQRLHRRVFLENINPENQALMILISCFVKTSHFEEYLGVKEAILLDLLRVVSHHRARLATPIRTIKKVYGEADVDDVSFGDTVFSPSRPAANRPFLLIEPSYKINGEDKTKASTRAVQTNDEEANVGAATASKSDSKHGSVSNLDTKTDDQIFEQSVASSSTNCNILASEKPQVNKPDPNIEESETLLPIPQANQGGERQVSSTSVIRPVLEDNILLGVALDGSKRTLPIEEEMAPSPISAGRTGTATPAVGSDKKDGHTTPSAKVSD